MNKINKIKNNKILFYKTNINNCFISIAQFELLGITIPKNTIVYLDKNNKIAYFCMRFPDYHGKKTVVLKSLWYDYETHTIGDVFLHDKISMSIFKAWIETGKNKCYYDYENLVNYEKLMRHTRKNKKRSVGVRQNVEQTTDALRYNQVTHYAYWENLNNYKSGNASVVASSILV